MIGFFPEFYPDEMLYSGFARYCCVRQRRTHYSGFGALAEDDLFVCKTYPAIDFVKKLSASAMTAITWDEPIEEIIRHRTIFNTFFLFSPQDMRERAMRYLINDRTSEYFRLAKKCGNSCNFSQKLYFCPVCAYEDRRIFGETYWHRKHQIPWVSGCMKHGTRLLRTEARVFLTGAHQLIAAERILPASARADSMPDGNQRKLNEYIVSVMDSEPQHDIGKLLSKYAIDAGFVTRYGNEIKTAKLAGALCGFYGSYLPMLPDKVKVNDILKGNRFSVFEICALGLMLGIPSF